MLYAFPDKSSEIYEVSHEKNALILKAQKGLTRLSVSDENCIRVTYTQKESFSERQKPGICRGDASAAFRYEETDTQVLLWTNRLKAVVEKSTGSIRFYDPDGKLLLQERETASKTLEEYQTYELAGDGQIVTEKIQTADGVKEVVRDALRIPGKKMYHTRWHPKWQDGEALYGLGQHEEGIGNLRGHMVYVHQANRKIAIPMLVSSLGYGILMNTDSPMIFCDNEFGTYLYTDSDEELDYYFMYGGNMDGVVRAYRKLTGKAAMLPKWAFGYLQSQERYESAEELIRIADAYRSRGIGVDALVLDWCSWEDGMWGQKSFDPGRFPDPAKMMEALHDKEIHLMMSVWPNMDEKCENYRQMQQNGMILPGSPIYNALSEQGRKLYWEQAQNGIFQYGVDGWWCDSSEPVTPEWSHVERVEPSVMFAEYCRDTANLLPAGEGNAYALYHAQALYEGQRSSGLFPEKRVVNLTRSAWTGQQRYGAILWSGDVDASWDTLRRQVAAGLHFCASGLPYWTTDIGAFFVKTSAFWYWKGQYQETTADLGYRELFTRWYQWGAFLPVFRGHGTDCRRELWLFGDEKSAAKEDHMFYDAILAANRLRYRLMPYIYSAAGKVWLEDAGMMRHLAFDFPEDETAREIFDQYLFGESLMVCPVTGAMYFGPASTPIQSESKTRRVYLPAGSGWYDARTGVFYEGGQWIEADAAIQSIPVFVKEGSIIPVTESSDRVQPREALSFMVYGTADAEYTLYRDAGDGYAYETGDYEYLHFTWDSASKCLTDDAGVRYPVRVNAALYADWCVGKKEDKRGCE